MRMPFMNSIYLLQNYTNFLPSSRRGGNSFKARRAGGCRVSGIGRNFSFFGRSNGGEGKSGRREKGGGGESRDTKEPEKRRLIGREENLSLEKEWKRGKRERASFGRLLFCTVKPSY